MKLPRLPLAGLTLICFLGTRQAAAAPLPPGPELPAESFEAEAVPAGWSAGGPSVIEITTERFKSGGRSLRWTCRGPAGILEVSLPDGGYQLDRRQALALWVHNEQPADGVLRLELLRAGSVIGRAWYSLQFAGWRPLGAPYAEAVSELAAAAAEPFRCDGFRLLAPADLPAGRLCFDLVNFTCPDPLKPDNQQPWVGKPAVLATATPESFIYSPADIARNRPWLPPLPASGEITAADRADMDLIRSRVLAGDPRRANPAQQVERLLPPDLAPRADPTALAEFRETLRIRRSPAGVLSGVPIVPPIHGRFGLKVFNSPPDGVAVATFPDAVTPLLRRLVSGYRFARQQGDEAAAAEHRDAVFDFFDHLLDQGFAEGNNNVSTYAVDLQAISTMREELAASGRLRDLLLAAAACSLRLHGDVLMVKDWAQTYYYHRDTDLQRDYRPLLWLTALLPDEAERLQRLRAYSRAVSSLFDPDLGEPYAWDGTGHHHPLFHLAYTAGVGFHEAHNLSGTQFRLAPRAIATLKRSGMLMAFAAGPSATLPPNLPGYTGQPMGIFLPFNTAKLAYSDTAEARDGIDPELAAVYLSIAGHPADDIHVKRFRDLGLEPARLEGHLSLNGAAIALHRRDDWLVSIAGEHRFRRNHEANVAYIGSNYGHYSRNGSVFVVSGGDPPSPWASGFSLEGWDPRHVPGTTAYLAEDEVALWRRGSQPLNTFGGGTNLEGDGIWGCDFRHESDRLPDNLTFRKSAFCFGDRVTLLTSDIGRGPKAGPAERAMPVITTLYQNALGPGGETAETAKGEGRFGFRPPVKPPPVKPADHPCWIGGEWVGGFPHAAELPGGAVRLLIDNQGTGYHVPASAPTIRTARREQRWTYFREYWAKPHARFPKGDPRNYKVAPGRLEDYEPTVDNFAVAWFEHGPAIDAADCSYTLLPRSTPESLADFARKMESVETAPVAVLQQDRRAHVLRDRPSQTTGYLVFESGPLGAEGVLQATNRPCAVMARETPAGLRLSVASTDLDDWPHWAGGRIGLSGEIVLSLADRWEVAAGAATAAEGAIGGTVLTIPYRSFLPEVIDLVARPAGPTLQAAP